MKERLKKIFIVAITLSCFSLSAGRRDRNADLNSFTADTYEYVFNHETPSSGTFIHKGTGTGLLSPFKEGVGTFEAFPTRGGDVMIVSESYSKACNLELRIRSEGLVNLVDGTFETTFFELTLTNTKTGASATTTEVVATGSLDPEDFDSFVTIFAGNFDDGFNPKDFRCRRRRHGRRRCGYKNNGFGNGDQDAPGKSGAKNNAENAE